MELREGYKQTEIGIIPSDWEVKKIGDFTDISSGGTPSTLVRDYWNGSIRWMNSGELNLKKVYDVENRITEFGLINSATKLIPVNCILIGLAGQGKTRGTVAINKVELCTNQSIAAIMPCDEVFYEFIYYNLDARYFELRGLSTGDGGRGGLNLTIIKNLEIPFPPTLTEQTLIATALSDADALISSLEKLIAKKRNIKQGAMQQLLIDNCQLSIDNGGWEVKKLGELAFVNMGQSPLSQFYNSEAIGLPLVQGNADVENRKTIIRFYTSMITKKGKVGDIIMSVRAPVGEISKATFDCCLGRGVCSISFDNEYLYHYLIYFEKSWAKLSTGSTFDSVNSKQVKELEIPIPKSKEEQTRIANILSDMDAEITALETKLEKYKNVKLGMMQNLLTGKIRLNYDF
jgi:type I restriction enzyme S subunit